MKGNAWKVCVPVFAILLLFGSTAAAEKRHFIGFGFDAAIVDSDLFFNEEEHIGFSVFGKYGLSDHWGLFFFYRDMQDDEDIFSFIGLEQDYKQFGAQGVYQWRPNKKLRPHVGFGLAQTDVEADFSGLGTMSDDAIGLTLSGGLEAGSNRFAFYGEYLVTVVDLDTFDPDETTIGNMTLGVVFRL